MIVSARGVVIALVLGALGAGGYLLSRQRPGGATPEEAVHGALDLGVTGKSPAAFLLDAARCRMLYASADAPTSSELGRASDEVSCERNEPRLVEIFGQLRDATYTIGSPRTLISNFRSYPVQIRFRDGTYGLWSLFAVRVDGRYFVGAKLGAPAPALNPIGQVRFAMNVAELRHALTTGAMSPSDGDELGLAPLVGESDFTRDDILAHPR